MSLKYSLRLITPPTELPVSLEEAKDHLRVDTSDEDANIGRLIKAAVAAIDGKTDYNRAIMPQTWEMQLDAFPSDEVVIPLAPLIEVEEVSYIGTDNLSATFTHFDVDRATVPARLFVATDYGWPTTNNRFNSATIRFVAGYDVEASPPEQVPENVRQAILLMVGDMYEFRESAVTGTISAAIAMTPTVQNLLRSWRLFL